MIENFKVGEEIYCVWPGQAYGHSNVYRVQNTWHALKQYKLTADFEIMDDDEEMPCSLHVSIAKATKVNNPGGQYNVDLVRVDIGLAMGEEIDEPLTLHIAHKNLVHLFKPWAAWPKRVAEAGDMAHSDKLQQTDYRIEAYFKTGKSEGVWEALGNFTISRVVKIMAFEDPEISTLHRLEFKTRLHSDNDDEEILPFGKKKFLGPGGIGVVQRDFVLADNHNPCTLKKNLADACTIFWKGESAPSLTLAEKGRKRDACGCEIVISINSVCVIIFDGNVLYLTTVYGSAPSAAHRPPVVHRSQRNVTAPRGQRGGVASGVGPEPDLLAQVLKLRVVVISEQVGLARCEQPARDVLPAKPLEVLGQLAALVEGVLPHAQAREHAVERAAMQDPKRRRRAPRAAREGGDARAAGLAQRPRRVEVLPPAAVAQAQRQQRVAELRAAHPALNLEGFQAVRRHEERPVRLRDDFAQLLLSRCGNIGL